MVCEPEVACISTKKNAKQQVLICFVWRDRLAGKAAYYLGEYQTAAEHFERAIKVNEKVLPAWEGLAFTQLGSGATPAALATYLKLVRYPCHV